MQFSLRTILVAMTAAAVFVAGVIALDGVLEQSYYGTAYFTLNVVSGLPTFVLWCVAGEWAFRRRRQSRAAKRLLAAILIAVTWMFVGSGAYVLVETQYSMEFVYTAFSVIQNLVEFSTWLLFASAVVQTLTPPPPRSLPSEEGTQPTLDSLH